MLRRLFGLLLILGSIFISWRIQVSRMHTQKHAEPLPLCKSLYDQFQADLSLKPYWGQVTGVTLLSQLHDTEGETLFKKCLVGIFNPVPKFKPEGFLIEVDLFDTKEKPNHLENTRAWKSTQTLESNMASHIVVQVSVLDAKSKNKLAESGATIDFETLEKSQKKTR